MGVAAGPWHIDDTLTFTVVTHRVDTGALTDADAVPAYRIYEDETGTAILTGNMAKLDDAGTTGFYSEQITLSVANGFENGKSYAIYVSAAVNSVTGGQTFNFKVDVPDVNLTLIAGSAVSTSTAQLGVNVVNAAGTAWLSGAITSATFTNGAIGSNAIASNAIGAAELAADGITEIADAVWAVAARTLTALDEDSTTLDLDATIRAALGLASANLDTQLTAIDDAVDTEIATLVTNVGTILTAVDTEIAALNTAVDDLPTNAELATALGTADDAVLAQIALVKAKTDSLTFTVAGQVDANVQYVNDVQVNGVGTAGNPWGP